MKIRLLALMGATAGLLFLAANESTAGNVSWSLSVFEGPLGQCGHWIERPGVGRCWHPAYVSSDWQPYCEGYWMWTDCGWYWVSDEQWGWATYHYGRWAYDSYYGWVWVPDTEWGPSWVSWREGGEYVGWAPLPPGSGFGPEGYWRERAVSDRFFVFVGVNHFAEPVHRRTVIVNNTTIINKTVNITKITRVNNVVVNHGPRVEAIEKVSSRKLTVAPTRVVGRPEVVRPGEPTRNALKSVPEERLRQPVKEGKREPEIIRGPPGTTLQPAGATTEPERKHEEKARVEKSARETASPSGSSPRLRPGEPSPYGTSPGQYKNFSPQNTGSYAATAPDSIHPRQRLHGQELQQNQPPHDQRGAVEKRAQTRQEERKEEKQKKGEPRGGD